MFRVLITARNQKNTDMLKNLIDWEKNGFSEINAALSTSDAYAFFRKHSPDLIIIDAQMPGMEGLGTIQKIREVSQYTQIIIITSEKDFKTAQQALQFRVASLLLWSDLQAGLLTNELVQIRNSLFEQLHWRGAVKRQLLRDIFKGKIPTENEIERFFEIKEKHVEYILLRIERDSTYQIIEEGIPLADYYAVNWHGSNFPRECSYIATINVSMHGWCTLLRIKDTTSMKRIASISMNAAIALQKSFEHQFEGTVTITYSRPFENFENVMFINRQLEECLKMRIYYGRSQIMSANDMPQIKHGFGQLFDDYAAKILQCLSESHGNEAQKQLNALFSQLSRGDFSHDAVRTVCNSLVELLNNYSKKNHIPTLNERILSNQIHANKCYSISEIGSWFSNVTAVLMDEAESQMRAKYSKKIQEILYYINMNYSEIDSVASLAERLHISNDYLRHLFKTETGKSLVSYITEVKINKAKNLLESGIYKILDVAEMTGFSTAQYFSAVFKKEVGISPRQFINQKD